MISDQPCCVLKSQSIKDDDMQIYELEITPHKLDQVD
jgi:hypothetical protein